MLLLELHVCGLQRLTKRGLLETGVGHLEVVHFLPDKHAHGTVGQLAMLSADVGVGALAPLFGVVAVAAAETDDSLADVFEVVGHLDDVHLLVGGVVIVGVVHIVLM